MVHAVVQRVLDIHRRRRPHSRLHVHTPAVEVKIVVGFVVWIADVGTVEPDDVAVLVLDPDAPEETPRASLLRAHIEDPCAHRAQELAPHEGEVVVLLVEPARIDEHHRHESGGRVLQMESFGQVRHEMEGTGKPAAARQAPIRLLILCIRKCLSEIHAPDHVLIGNRDLIELLVGTQVLNVRLHDRGALLDLLNNHLLARDRLLYQALLLRGKGQSCRSTRVLLRLGRRNAQQ